MQICKTIKICIGRGVLTLEPGECKHINDKDMYWEGVCLRSNPENAIMTLNGPFYCKTPNLRTRSEYKSETKS
ncbi:hypothetical protein HanHA89_Chr15g0619121 [Helianthus annuus]|nr:hypothetical protein HanHA89_Chr15g0619121 [Helianthus annuus]